MSNFKPEILLSDVYDGSGGLNVSGGSADYYPGYGDSSQGGGVINVDSGGNLITRGGVMTDAGGFRANFTGTSILTDIGECTFINGSDIVTGTGFATNNVIHVFDYVKLGTDADTAMVQVISIVDDNTLMLTEAYSGTGGTGTSYVSFFKQEIGTNGSISVGSGVATIASGTTSNQTTKILRKGDYPPLVVNTRVTISQRIANQTTYVGLVDMDNATPRYFARFSFSGITNTTIVTESGWNATGAPSANETESTTITLPGGLTTATANDYRIEVESDRISFFVNNSVVAVHTRVTMHPYLLMGNYVSIVNGTSPATTTSVTVDYYNLQNIESFKTMPVSIADNKWRYSSVTTSTLIKTGSGTLGYMSVMQTNATAVTAGQLTIYDNTTNSGSIIWTGQVTASINPIYLNVDFVKGCYVTFTTLANVTASLSYR